MSYGPRTFYVLSDDHAQLMTNDDGSLVMFHDRYSAGRAAEHAGAPWTVKPLTY